MISSRVLAAVYLLLGCVGVMGARSYTLDEGLEFIMSYTSGQDVGKYVEAGTKAFTDLYENENLQASITTARESFSERARSGVYNIVTDEQIDAYNEKGYFYPWKPVTEEEEELAPKVEELLYNTDRNFTDVPNIVYIMLDDAGWNDVDLGIPSTRYEGLFPNINEIVKDGGITLTNYMTGMLCTPGRHMFLTGKYSSMTGMDDLDSEMWVEDVTIGLEMKTAGYNTAIVGKWGLNPEHPLTMPNAKGFDYFYGSLSSYIDKYSLWTQPKGRQTMYEEAGFTGSFADMWEDDEYTGKMDSDWLSDSFLDKAKAWLTDQKDEEEPFFLYFASDLPHSPVGEAAERYQGLCSSVNDDLQGVCEYMFAIDDLVSDITCIISDMGVLENTLFVLAGDNGGASTSENVPFYGEKAYVTKGGYSVPAAIFGPMVPEELRGTTYDGMFHVTDWTPTLMHAATNGQWNGAMGGGDIDGIDQWGAVMEADGTKPRTSTLLYADAEENLGVVVDVDGVTLGYHMGTAWKDVVDTTDTVSYEGEPVEVSQCVLDSTLSSTLALEAVSAIVGMHGATGATTRYLLLIGAMLIGAFALALRRHQGSKGVIAAQMRAAMGAKAPIADSVDMSYGTV